MIQQFVLLINDILLKWTFIGLLKQVESDV